VVAYGVGGCIVITTAVGFDGVKDCGWKKMSEAPLRAAVGKIHGKRAGDKTSAPKGTDAGFLWDFLVIPRLRSD